MKNVWLIGAGDMAQNYVKVLEHLNIKTTIIGRGNESAKKFKNNTGYNVEVGGLENFLATKPSKCTHAIIAVGVEKLYETAKQLLDYNVKTILIEKPGALLEEELEDLTFLVKNNNANVLIAYNRRFYASVIEARKIVQQDGGVLSFNFEFTEWSHIIEPLKKASGVKEKWFLANSTHVADLAFYLGGFPKKICSFTSGKLSWHPSSSNFCGAGISNTGALFNYQANWESAGRWSVEILTKKNRLILRPMEKLQIQKIGSVQIDYAQGVDYSLDEKFKPGLYLQTKLFIDNNFQEFCGIESQTSNIGVYNQIANY